MTSVSNSVMGQSVDTFFVCGHLFLCAHHMTVQWNKSLDGIQISTNYMYILMVLYCPLLFLILMSDIDIGVLNVKLLDFLMIHDYIQRYNMLKMVTHYS